MYPTPYLGSDFYITVTVFGFIALCILACLVSVVADQRDKRKERQAAAKIVAGKGKHRNAPKFEGRRPVFVDEHAIVVDSRTGEVIS